MPIPYAVSRWGHASNAAHPRDAGSVSRDPALTSDATAAPPETLRRIFLRANGDERRVISLQVAWMVHVFRHDGRTPCAHACGRPSAGADAVRGDLPFDKAALKRAWTTQFPHLLDDGRAGPAVRDLIAWCRGHRARAGATSLWHWLPLAEGAWQRCLAIGERPDLEGGVSGRGSHLAQHNLDVLRSQLAMLAT